MKILITAVGQRIERWADLFAHISELPDAEVTVAVADLPTETREWLRSQPTQHLLELPHVLGHNRTGRIGSTVLHPGGMKALADQKPDIVHIIGEASYLSTWQILRYRARHWPEVPVTLHAAQNVATALPQPLRRVERYAFEHLDHAFPITPGALHVLRTRGYRRPATVMPLGVNLRRFTPNESAPAPHHFTVGFVGQLEPRKGIQDLIDAGRRLDADLIFVGSGSLADDVRLEAYRRPGQVILLDPVEHPILPEMLRRMDVLVLPSVELMRRNFLPWQKVPVRERFGRVLIEAMACGVPVVGSDVGEIPATIGNAGLTYVAGDVAALAERLARLRDEPGLAGRFAQRGLSRAATFGWDRIAENLFDNWQRLANRKPATVAVRESVGRP